MSWTVAAVTVTVMGASSSDPEEVLTRAASLPDFTLAYGSLPDQVADVRLPLQWDRSLPLVIAIHGGFWKSAYDRVHLRPAADALASAGYPVASLEYRRVGAGGGWPATFDDVAAGVAAVPALVDAALVDRGLAAIGDRGVVLIGHSAGGQLVLWAGRGVAGVRGIVALAPVADMARGFELALGGGAVARVLGGAPSEVPERYAELDPAVNLPLGKPTIVIHGRLDQAVPWEIGRDWVAASAAAGDEATLIDLADIEHFGLIDPLSSAWPLILRGLASVCDAGEDSGRATSK